MNRFDELMTEAELCGQILERTAERHLRAIQFPDSRRLRGDRGFPDMVIAGPLGILFRELKTEGGQLDRDQVRWRYLLLTGETGQISYGVWRPADLSSGLIPSELDSITR